MREEIRNLVFLLQIQTIIENIDKLSKEEVEEGIECLSKDLETASRPLPAPMQNLWSTLKKKKEEYETNS